MSQTVSFPFQVTWADLDSNRHLRNTGYFDYAAQSRFLYFASCGFGPAKFAESGIGPAVITETIRYRKELGFLEEFRVDLLCGGTNATQERFEFVNRFMGADGVMHAELKTRFVWFSLRQRKPATPPQQLLDAMINLPRTEDYAEFG